jgi:hypothetical protein
VVGRDAGGYNFCMRDGETALVANSQDEAADALRSLEDPELRERLSRAGLACIRRFSPDAEPTRFWREFMSRLS